jgi:hypothetical protein
MKKIKKLDFVNAKEMSLLHPDTFEYPEEDVKNLKKGDIVKVCAENKERFWTVIESIKGDKIIAVVDSGDLIEFTKENIYQVWQD